MRRFLETFVTLVTALLLVGTWLVEPYSVVSGSMHPTVLGPHYDFTCPKCGTRNFVPADRPLPDFTPLSCERCSQLNPPAGNLSIVSGDSVLVDRTAFML